MYIKVLRSEERIEDLVKGFQRLRIRCGLVLILLLLEMSILDQMY